MAVKHFGHVIEELQLVVVYASVSPCMYASGSDFAAVIFEEPVQSVSPCLLYDQPSFVFIPHGITHSITLACHVSLRIIFVGCEYCFFSLALGMRAFYFQNVSVTLVAFYGKLSSRTVGNLLQVSLVVVPEPYGESVRIRHALQQVYIVIFLLCESVVQVFVHVPDAVSILFLSCFFAFCTDERGLLLTR